jgi:hypothetical protein
MNAPAPTDEEIPPFGPKMQALSNDWRRRFVVHLFDENAPRKGDGLMLYAARAAGFGNGQGTTSDKSYSVIAARLASDPAVRAAIAEYSQAIVRIISPEAIKAVRALIRDPKARDHMRAVAAVLDRVDPIETTHTVHVEDYRPPDPAATAAVLRRIAELARAAGMPALPAPIDAEVVEIPKPADEA